MFKFLKTKKLHAEAAFIIQNLLEAPEISTRFEDQSSAIANECVSRIATQNPELKELWKGRTPHPVAYAMTALSLNIHVDLITKDTDPTFVMGLTEALSQLVTQYMNKDKTGITFGFGEPDYFAVIEASKTARAAQEKLLEVFGE